MPEPFEAHDLDGDALEIDIAEPYAQRSYDALLAVVVGCDIHRSSMFLGRSHAIRLRDYLNEVLDLDAGPSR